MVSSTPLLEIEDEFFAAGCKVHDSFKRYFLEDKVFGGHYQIHLHSNGLCYLTLASTHPLIKDNYVIKSVEYTAQRLSNQVSGKRKRGSQSLYANSFLCTVYTVCEKSFIIRASVEGKLAEVNKRLVTIPQEIQSPVRGYLAIFMTKFVEGKTPVPKTWISEQDFLNGKITVDVDEIEVVNDEEIKPKQEQAGVSTSEIMEVEEKQQMKAT